MSIHQPISNTSGELVGFCDRSECGQHYCTRSALHPSSTTCAACAWSKVHQAQSAALSLRRITLLRRFAICSCCGHEMSGNSCEVSCIMTLSDVCLLSLMIIFLSTGLQGSPNVRKWRAGSDVEHCLHKTNKEAFHAQEELLGNDCVGFGS